ncbi:hypothetical protein EDB89DRAFT_2071391 [Lactarius sanguifluus]|nr:hypothetical protein EDB89DRAFT_2071391 [Lactarius sanguifluus]
MLNLMRIPTIPVEPPVWSAPPSLPCMMTVQRRFVSVKEGTKGEYVALDTRPPSNDELEELKDGDEKL